MSGGKVKTGEGTINRMKSTKTNHLNIVFLCAILDLILVFCGCAGMSHETLDKSAVEDKMSTKLFNHVALYTQWFTGEFGDGSQEWNGLNFDDKYGGNAVGLHPVTKSEFHFKVRIYPGLAAQFNNQTNFLHKVASETEAMNKIKFTAESWESLPIEQYYSKNGKFTSTNFIFLCREGELMGPLPWGIYPVRGKLYFKHYLAEIIRSDTKTNLSGTVFHAMAFIPETVDPKEREHLVYALKLFIINMALVGDPTLQK
jgi:hypothetical protein